MKRYLFCSVITFFALITLANANEVIKAKIIESYGKIPLSFTANEGQFDTQVKFKTSGNGATMFFTQEGTTFLFSRKAQSSLTERMIVALKQSIRNLFSLEPYELFEKEALQRDQEYYTLKLCFVNANPNPEVVGEEMLAGNTNYFIGNNPDKWITDVPSYSKIRLENLYKGIDLVYYGTKNKMKYDFVVQPGADLSQITLAYDFGNNPIDNGSIEINNAGELVVKTPFGDLVEQKPYAYQINNGKKDEIAIEYKIINKELHTFAFSVGSYNSDVPLTIDPELAYSTLLGGNNRDQGKGIVVDGNGNVYIVGYTSSADFPVTPGAYDQNYNGGPWYGDVFVCKLNSTGSELLYSTFIGGSGEETGTDIAIDNAGNAYITGETWSTNFPATPGAFDIIQNGDDNDDVFVCKLNMLSGMLEYSTFLGGRSFDAGYGIAVDGSGNAYVTGFTYSTNFPVTSGAYDRFHNGGGHDAFISKLNVSGSALVYSTFLGGDNYDDGRSIAIDRSGNAYVTGWTNSASFPVIAGAYDQSYNGGSYDSFVSKLNPSGSTLVYSSFLGGNDTDYSSKIIVDDNGNAYICGFTSSSNFPTISGAYDQSFNGGSDTFISKLNASGSALEYSTLLGGIYSDNASCIQIDGSGNAYILGYTISANFPTTPGAYDRTLDSGTDDVFFSKFNASGSVLEYSTLLGGSGDDIGCGIALDGKGNVYITGYTASVSNFPTTVGAYDRSHNGFNDMFVSKFAGLSLLYDSLRVSIPDTLLVGSKKFPGDTILVPVSFNKIEYNQHNGIFSFQTTITYNDSLFQCIGYDSSGTVLSNRDGLTEFTIKFRKDSGRGPSLDTLRIAGASDDSLYYPEVPGTPFAFPRPLIKLKFRIPTTAHNGDSTVLHFTRFMFNEGIPSSSTDDGSIKLRLRKRGDVDKNGAIQPYDAVLVLRYVVQDTILDAESREAAEVSGNGEITAYDASLILQYYVGKITTFPAGSYYKQALPSNKSADIVMEWGEVKDGIINLLVKAKNLTEVYGYSLALSYNPSVLIYQGYQSSDMTKRMTAVVRNESGQLRMAVAGVEPLDGDGEIVAFKFKLNSNGDLNRDKLINLNELVLNEEIIISNATISSLPKTYSLEQNYPNPFNPETRIRYQILEARNVQLIVYNLLGQPVRTLVNEMKPAGVYEIRWDGKNDQGINLASGVYIYRIKAGNFVSTRKLILMK